MIRHVETKNVLTLVIVLQTLYALLVIIEDTVHALRATQETLTKEDVPRYLK